MKEQESKLRGQKTPVKGEDTMSYLVEIGSETPAHAPGRTVAQFMMADIAADILETLYSTALRPQELAQNYAAIFPASFLRQ